MEVWQCVICTLIYDEAIGYPKLGISPGTPWHELPDYWKCPDCGANKANFESIPIEEYLNQMFILGED
ncbi:rubredoxin [Methylotenera versatilis]|uniref:rubredoxin n=1 Tax=Methylotenera versatilis TaxID=1055487 RepID=UPI00068C9F41|nr:rubredoxin [Methylotenera versatilis]